MVLPAALTLVGPGARHALLVETRRGAAYAGDLTPAARFTSSNPKVAVVGPDGTVRAVGEGTTAITARVQGSSARAVVRVKAVRKPLAWSFTNQIVPVLTKTGCNSGACHGAAAGKGGLKLTLRGYDPPADYATLTRQALGRRIVPAEPGKSLVLQKPAGGVPHGGGIRFKPNSPEYRLIHRWIAAGCPPPAAADPAVQRLDVLPPSALLKPGQRQQILVRAAYSDGRVEDVTRWVRFGSSEDLVASVDDSGRVTMRGSGEAAVTVSYGTRVAFARVTSPYPKPPPPAAFARSARRNFIDELVLRKLQSLGIAPAGLCSDEEFIRRAYLDAAGMLPTPEEVREFLAECEVERSGFRVQGSGSNSNRAGVRARARVEPSAPKARERLVESLFTRSEFTDYWAYRWSDLLLVSSRKLPSKGMWAFYNWIRDGVAENKPWDRFAREVVTASGSTLRNGAANFYVLHKDPIDLNETVSQAFLGMSLTCARCHNHPMEKWTQRDYYGMVSLFSRVRMKNGDTGGETLVFPAEDGEVSHPRAGVPMPPKPLDAPAVPPAYAGERRAYLADWLTAPSNPYFARAIVNRVWRNFMARGIVEAEDDLRLTNPPSNEELLTGLTADFVRNGYDLKRLIRTIMTSATYWRSSTSAAGSPADSKYYSTYIPRRLPAEVMLDAISTVAGVPTDFPGYPAGTRALQLPDAQVASYFLTAFGRPQRVQTCSCERQEEPNVAQALHLSNGDTINGKLRASGSTPERLLKEGLTNAQALDRLYLLALGRAPRRAEREKILAALRLEPDAKAADRDAIEDLAAALLTSKEFLFNH